MTTNNNGTISAEEYEAMDNKQLSEQEIQRMFLSRFKFNHQPAGGRYTPATDADHTVARPYLGYYINYSFPAYKNKPVASVWTVKEIDGEMKYKPFHFDLDKFTVMLVGELKKHGFNPPPQKDYKPAASPHTSDDKPY